MLRRFASAALLSAALLARASAAERAPDAEWRPVDPSELAMKSPLVERDADAEAIFWDVRVDDAAPHDLVMSNYVRIKIFTERGRDTQDKVELPYANGAEIADVAARTIRPDGTTVELKKEDVFEKTVVRGGGLKVRVKSFVLPGVGPGSVVEYRWREVFSHGWAQYARLPFQRDIPVESVTYHIKPSLRIIGARAIRFQTFRMEPPKFVEEKGGFYSATVTGVPAYRDEPFSPPEDNARRWILLYYSADQRPDPQGFWKRAGKLYDDYFRNTAKPDDDVKRKAAELVGDAQTPDQKLERLYDFCRTQIKNLSDDALDLSVEERARLISQVKGPGDTLRQGHGSSREINELFAALAGAAGFDVRFALSADRARALFDPNFADLYFMRRGLVLAAVRLDDRWRFFSPASTYVPFGMLPWRAEAEDVLLADQTEGRLIRTPLTPPEKSSEKRTARLRLLEDGTLEGDVRIEYAGHVGSDMKEFGDTDSPQRREQRLRDGVKARMSTAELSDIKIENVTDPVKPFVYEYKVRVPGYAQRTGKRLFLQPAFFEHGLRPLFPASERHNQIYFHYPWSEADTVEIDLPAGYAVESADAPDPLSQDLGEYYVKVSAEKDGRALVYRRYFTFSGGGRLLFPVNDYPALKTFFDETNERDGHTVTLRPAA